MNISEAAERTDLTVDTIRYYDRVGILGALDRTAGGARRFSDDDLGWLRILRCLRDTGMSMADLQRFCAVDGDRDPASRRKLLQAHRATVLERMEQTRHELEVLDGKIAHYRDAERRGARVEDVTHA